MAQTSYSSQPSVAVPGGKGDTGFDRVLSGVNQNVSPIPVGIFLKDSKATYKNGVDLIAAATDVVAGIALRDDVNPVDGLTGIQTIDTLNAVDVMEKGAAWVRAEQVMNPGDPVYVRFANAGGGAGATNQKGIVRKDSDSGTAMLLEGARVLNNGLSFLGVQMTEVYYDRAAQDSASDEIELPFSNGSLAATTTAYLTTTKSDRHFVLDEVVYDNPTGFATDVTNDWKIEVKTAPGGVSLAAWDTTTGQQGTLAADTPVTLLNAALASRTVNPATRLNVVFTKLNAPANLPVGNGVVRGHYI